MDVGRVLAFDTSGPWIDAAIGPVRRREARATGQAERLMPLLEEMLAQAGLGWSDLRAIGVGTGPGNFTGTRIAVSAARGLALGLGVPAEGVGLVEAVRHVHARGANGSVPLVCLPAPRGRVLVDDGGDGGGDAGAGLVPHDPAGPLPPAWSGRAVAGPAADRLATGGAAMDPAALAPAIAAIAAARAAPGRRRPAPLYARAPDAAPGATPPPVS